MGSKTRKSIGVEVLVLNSDSSKEFSSIMDKFKGLKVMVISQHLKQEQMQHPAAAKSSISVDSRSYVPIIYKLFAAIYIYQDSQGTCISLYQDSSWSSIHYAFSISRLEPSRRSLLPLCYHGRRNLAGMPIQDSDDQRYDGPHEPYQDKSSFMNSGVCK